MKSISCLIWMLIGFVVLAAADRVPDPPSAKPDTVKCSVSSAHELPVAFATTSHFLVLVFGKSENSTASVPPRPVLPAQDTRPLERATDPSPPTLHS